MTSNDNGNERGAFLAYMFRSAKPPWWRRDPLLGAMGLFKDVLLQLSDSGTVAAVRSAIERSSFSRLFAVRKGAGP
jgi:hypothetical protein